MPRILQPEASYTFRSFFELPNDPDEILGEAKQITQDIGGYQVPDDVEDLVRVLVGILEED